MRLFNRKPTFKQTPISLFCLTLLRFANHYLCNIILFADIFLISIIDSLLLLFHCYFFSARHFLLAPIEHRNKRPIKHIELGYRGSKNSSISRWLFIHTYFHSSSNSFLCLLIAPRHHTMLSWLLFRKRFIWGNIAVDSQILLRCSVLFVRYWLISLFSFLYCFV